LEAHWRYLQTLHETTTGIIIRLNVLRSTTLTELASGEVGGEHSPAAALADLEGINRDWLETKAHALQQLASALEGQKQVRATLYSTKQGYPPPVRS
jgi:hypothetical protein